MKMETETIRLFRRRYIPDEMIELKDDEILSFKDNLIITKWNSLKPRTDFAGGFSAYFIDRGIKVSKILDKDGNLVHWYCDIVEPEIDAQKGLYIFHDLLIDVIVEPDYSVKVLDMDEFADIMEQGMMTTATIAKALRAADSLLRIIYSGQFHDLTCHIENFSPK